jgi:benzoate-CoA ligase
MRPVTAPPADFNFAQHLIASNAHRAVKTALIDDIGALTYGELTEQIRRFAGGLQSMGIRREERVLLLMQDSSDWVVAFSGRALCGRGAGGREHLADGR